MEEKIIAVIEKLSMVWRRLHRDTGKTHGLAPLQVQILAYLGRAPQGLSGITQIALELGLTKATVSEAVDSLFRKGLLSKTPMPEDRRRQTIDLTGDGRRLEEELGSWKESVRSALRQFPSQSIDETAAFLIEFLASLQRNRSIDTANVCPTCEHFRVQPDLGDADPFYCTLLDRSFTRTGMRIDCHGHRKW